MFRKKKEENKIKIKNITEKKLDIEDCNLLFKDYFESSNINFLFGSGFSADKLAPLGEIEKCFTFLDNEFQENENETKKFFESYLYSYYFLKSIYPQLDDLKQQNNKLDFDDANQFALMIKNVLNKRHDKNLHKKVNIFSTNYDMYLELALENNEIYYNDGFIGRYHETYSTASFNNLIHQSVLYSERERLLPTVNIFKIHGSLSWLEKEDEQQNKKIYYERNLGKKIENIEKIRKNIFSHHKSNKRIKIDIFQKFVNSKKNEETLETKIFLDEYKKLNIINPTKEKFNSTLFKTYYYDLLRLFSIELEKENSLLIVFGFSFADEHILNITKRILQNPSLNMFIFIYDQNNLSDFEEIFNQFSNVYYVYSQDKINLNIFNKILFGAI